MDLQIKSQKELMLLIFGMHLGRSLNLDIESLSEAGLDLGDFQGVNINIDRSGEALLVYGGENEKGVDLALVVDGCQFRAEKDAKTAWDLFNKQKVVSLNPVADVQKESEEENLNEF